MNKNSSVPNQSNINSPALNPNKKINNLSSPTLQSAINASRPAYIAIGFFSFFINLLMLTGPLFMLQIYDRVLSSRSLPTLAVLFALVAALFLVMGLLEFTRTRILARIGVHVSERIRERLFDAVMQLALHTGGNERSTTPLRGLDTIKQYLSGAGFVVFFDAPWVPVYIGVIFLFHPMLGWLAVVSAIILLLIALLNDFRSRKPSKDAAMAVSQTYHIAEIGRKNGEVLASMGIFNALRTRWKNMHNSALIAQTKAADRLGSLSALSKSFRLFVQSAMLAAGAIFVIYGEITAGAMIAASIILGRALQPIEQAISQWRSFVQYREAKQNLKKLLENVPEQEELTSLKKPRGHIKVQGLHASAPNSEKIALRNISINLPAGKILGVIGDSASGKTSLARILVGVWKPKHGEIRIDGATYDQWTQGDLGKYIGYLPQGVELFDGTIAENISRLEENPNSKDIIKAAKQAGVHEMIKQLGGYDVQIGIGGGVLAAGQRQRIALARALYGEPVLLVLDEPNSNLDDQGDFALFEAIKEMRKNGQTVVIIAHRKDILSQVDDMLVLHEGNQVAYGPRDKILEEIRKRQTKLKRNVRRTQRQQENATSGFQVMTGSNHVWSNNVSASSNNKKDDK